MACQWFGPCYAGQTMYTIKEAAARTGLAVATIRVWERRYGVVTPGRTPAGYRLYDDESIARLAAMHHLVADEGWQPRQAAEHVRRNGVDPGELGAAIPGARSRPAPSAPGGPGERDAALVDAFVLAAHDLDDLQSTGAPFSGPRAYARAKRAQVALVREWARRLGPPGIAINAMHPGWADTPGLAEALPTFRRRMRPVLRTAAEGADTLVWLVAAPEGGARTGQLFLDRRPRPFDRIPATRLSAGDRRRLWDLVVSLSGASDPLPEG